MERSDTKAFLMALRHPAVRHLAWMLTAPQLYASKFTQTWHLTDAIMARLFLWDEDPAKAPPVIKAIPHQRLGLYFESLYECLLTELLGWPLIAKNLPVRSKNRTLGEYDFLVRNRDTGEIEHHEIAVKFYLGYSHKDHSSTLWYGPNAKDRLDVKVNRLLHHQTRLTEQPEAADLLDSLSISPPQHARVFMPGYLFYSPSHSLKAPGHVPPEHLKGLWYHLGQLSGADFAHCVALRKPQWVGPWLQTFKPSIADTLANVEAVKHRRKPQLFARMSYSESLCLWQETERFFVVPDGWPGFR